MLTYDLDKKNGSLYIALCNNIKNDILNGKLKSNEKLPSKRVLSKHLGISVITTQAAYEQLIQEGYIYSVLKKGYFVCNIKQIKTSKENTAVQSIMIPGKNKNIDFDFTSQSMDSNNFPFSVWAKLMRKVVSTKEKELLTVSECSGTLELRKAICAHLKDFRGVNIQNEQVIIGAGTEYLYGLLIKLLGKDKLYCLESPGYSKIAQIYSINEVKYKFCALDQNGISIDELNKTECSIVHISPTHHFPTGITMPVARRYELLEWANKSSERYIIEDDYDSEFRLNGNPVEPLMSLDNNQKVIYINTFSKSLASTIRISYMVLPPYLAQKFYNLLGFYSCTVPTFEQFTLSEFINQKYFEKHINRMRILYTKKRNYIIQCIKEVFLPAECTVIPNDSGLHFLIKFNTDKTDAQIESLLEENRIRIKCVADYIPDNNTSLIKNYEHKFIFAYSNIKTEGIKDSLLKVRALIFNR